MSQTNTNTNNGSGNTNRNQIFGRGGRGRGGPGGRGRGDCSNGRGNISVAIYSFEGKMKDGPISKLTSTETGHRATQYKKIIDTHPVLCADKNYQGIDDVIRNGIDLVEANFTPIYPNENQWSNTHHVEITSVDPTKVPAIDGSHTPIIVMEQRTHIF